MSRSPKDCRSPNWSLSSDLAVGVGGKGLDAANLGEATKTPLEQLVAFKHVEKPKGLPLAELVALFEFLGLAEGLIRNENTHDEAVKQLRAKANELIEKVVTVTQYVQTGLPRSEEHTSELQSLRH